MDIDWSKAPEGCLEVGRNQWDEMAWLCADGYIYHNCNGCMVNWKTPRALKRSDFDVVDIRPDQEWSGEGLPSVGTHVAVHDADGTLMYGHGESGEVLAHVENTAVIRMSYGLGCFTARNLRTPEQIAAEGRTKAIDEMVKLIGVSSRRSAEALYDAGYRKQEQK